MFKIQGKALIVGTLIASSLLVFPLQGISQNAGSKVEVSPFMMKNQWFPATVLRTLPNGDLEVRLDPREGYNEEVYVIQKQWAKPAAAQAAPNNGQMAGGALAGQAAGGNKPKVGDTVEASPFSLKNQWFKGQVVGFQNGMAVVRLNRPGYNGPQDFLITPEWVRPPTGAVDEAGNQPGQTQTGPTPGNQTASKPTGTNANPANGKYKVGDRVLASPDNLKDEKYWQHATVTKVNPDGTYEIHTDQRGTRPGLWYAIRPEWMKPDATPKPVAADTKNFLTTNKPMPTHQVVPRSPADCQPNAARWKELISEQARFNFSTQFDQADVAFDTFQISGPETFQSPYFGANNTKGYRVHAEYRVRAIRRSSMQGENYVRTVVYGYKPDYMFYVNNKGQCEFGTVQGTAGTLLSDEQDRI